MAKGHIVKGVKDAGVYIIRPAHGNLLRFRAGGPGDELVGYQHVAGLGVQVHGGDGGAEGVGVGVQLRIGEKAPELGGLQKGQEV